MNRKSKLLGLLTSSILIATPTYFIVSCSSNQQQDEANKIYKEIYDHFENENKYGDSSYYANSIYDLETFRNLTIANPIKNIQSTNLEFSIANLDYAKVEQGELQFTLILRDKKSKKAVLPSLKSNASKDEYFTNNLTISGFKKISSDLLNEAKNVYESLKQPSNRFDLNEKGKEWIQSNFQNIEENIDFNDSSKQSYFGNFINIPNIIDEKGFKIFKFITNILNKNPINQVNENELVFSFWVLLSKKSEPNIPIAIPFSLKVYGSNNEKNEVIEIKFIRK